MKQPIFQKTSSAIRPLLLLLGLLMLSYQVAGQEENPAEPLGSKAQYIRFKSGISIGPFMTIEESFFFYNYGIYMFAEFQRTIHRNWLYGLSIDGMLPATGNLLPLVKNVSVSIYHRLPIIRDRLFVLPGLGVGSNIIFVEDDRPRMGPTVNVNLSMLWQVSPGMFLEFSPLLIYPTRANIPVSYALYEAHPNSMAFTISAFTIGITFGR